MLLYGVSFSENQPAIEIRRLYCIGMEKLRSLSNECDFYEHYWTYGSVPVVMKSASRDLYSKFLKDAVQYILAELGKAKIYDYDEARITKAYSKYAIHYLAACNDIYAQYCEIQGDVKSAKLARERAKENRGRFVGGGFGIAGAAKGIAMAGAANLATGAIYSAGNLIGNTVTKISANGQSNALYESQRTTNKLYKALQQDFLVGVDVLEEILVSVHGRQMKNPFDNQCLEKAKAIMKNIADGIIPKPEQKKLLVDAMLNNAPYYDEIYLFAYEQFGDDSSNLIEFAKLFGKDDIIVRIKSKIREKEHDQAVNSLKQKFFGENLEKVNAQLKWDSKFSEFNDYYYYPTLGLYIDQGFPEVLKKLRNDLLERKELTNQQDLNLILFDDSPNSDVERYLELCDPVGLFLPEETAYCFINLGISKDSKGILVTSKGLYFSSNCMIEKHFMSYDGIDGIAENRELYYEGKEVAGIDAYVSKTWANLLAFIVLFFKYGDIKYTGKIVSNITHDSQQKLDELGQSAKNLNEGLEKFFEGLGNIGAVVGSVIGAAIGIGFWVWIISLIFRFFGR